MADFLYQYVHGVGEYSIILGTDYNITCKIGSARFWSLHIRKVGKRKALELDNSMYLQPVSQLSTQDTWLFLSHKMQQSVKNKDLL